MALFPYNYTLVFSFTTKKEMLRICGLFSIPNGISLDEIAHNKEEKFSTIEINTSRSIVEMVDLFTQNQVMGIEGIWDHTHNEVYTPPDWAWTSL